MILHFFLFKESWEALELKILDLETEADGWQNKYSQSVSGRQELEQAVDRLSRQLEDSQASAEAFTKVNLRVSLKGIITGDYLLSN
jgi:hypothetical protein